METVELRVAEKQIQDALLQGEMEKAQTLLLENESDVRPIFQAFFEASIGLAMGNMKQVWKNIAKGLALDSSNYELYMMLGDYYAAENLQKTFLCYENALFYCDVEEDRVQIEMAISNLTEQGICVPKVAIVVIAEHLADTIRCIESIRRTTFDKSREIIVIDDTLTDDGITWLKQQGDIRFFHNENARGFSGKCNQGIQIAEQEADILMLDDLATMTENALFWLRMGLYESEQVASTGSRFDLVRNDQKVTEEEWHIAAQESNVPMDAPYVNKETLGRGVFLLKRSALEKVGYFDEQFTLGHYEINDLCLRIILEGYHNVLCKNGNVLLNQSSLFSKEIQEKNTLWEKEKGQFYEKWKAIGLTPRNYQEVRMDLVNILSTYHTDGNEKIMAIGMGCGATLDYLQSKFPNDQLFAIEQNPFLAKISNEIIDTVSLNLDEWKGDELQDTFDVILVNETLEFTKNPEMVLSELSKMLKKDGRIVIGFYNRLFYERIEKNIGQDILFDRDRMKQLIDNIEMVADDWTGIQLKTVSEQEQRRICQVTSQNPMVPQEELITLQWTCIMEKKRNDIKFGNKMVVCKPVYGHPEVVEDVLQHCAELYKRYALDVYFYDSSKDKETEKVIEKYQAKGYDNLYYIAVDPEMPVIDKFENIYLLKGIKKKYKYMWYVKERCWCEEKTLKLMYKAVNGDYDLIFMDVGHPQCKTELTLCNDANEFYHQCGDFATSMDTTVYNIDTMLENSFDIEEFHKKYNLKCREAFIFFLFIFEQLSRKNPPQICLLAGRNVTIYNSVLGHSSWGNNRIEIWGKTWIETNEILPECYTERNEIIKRTASFPWILGDLQGLIELHDKGILTKEYYEQIKNIWEQVSNIPLDILKEIAYGNASK